MNCVELKDFVLIGHSFGGYICGNYALKYPDKIKKLIMLSPLGLKLTDVAIDESGETISKNNQQLNPTAFDEFPIVVQKGLSFIWERKISPFECFRFLGEPCMKEIITKYMEKRIEDEWERAIVGAYTYQIFMKENGTSEYAMLINFSKALQCYLPLGTSQKLASPDFPVPISIVMGDDDWMREVDLGASELIVMYN